jgi:hypothetical protein
MKSEAISMLCNELSRTAHKFVTKQEVPIEKTDGTQG